MIIKYLIVAFIGLTSLDAISKIDVQKKEISLASNIKQVYNLTSKGTLNKKLIFKLSKQLKKQSLFKEFRFWNLQLIKLTSRQSLNKTKSHCESLVSKTTSDPLKKLLIENVVSLCFQKYLKDLANYSTKSIRFHKNEIQFIKFNTKYILNDFNTNELEYLLSRFKRDEKKNELYTDAFFDYFMAINKAPSKNIFRYANLRPQHTKFLQSKDLEHYNTQYIFYTELKKLKTDAFNTLENSDNNKEVTLAYNRFYNYFNLTFDNQPKNKAILSLQSLSKSYMRRAHYELARKGFRKILDLKSYHYNSAVFDNMWSYILEEDYNGALNAANKFTLDSRFLKENPKTHFWLAHIYEKIGKVAKAKNAYLNIIKSNPLSFYAIQSSKLLGQKLQFAPGQIYESYISKNDNTTSHQAGLNDATIKKVLVWGIVHQLDFMEIELDKLKAISDKESREESLTKVAKSLSSHNEYLKSFQVIYRSLDDQSLELSREHLQILFPRPYFGHIKKSSQSFDPIIALSLIRQESGFNASAKSHVGARGLMQLMPTTAKQMRKKLKARHLYNPKLNIKLGTRFFGQLLDHYDENLVYSLAAYNAGKRRVDEWQSSYLNKESILENIENIPFTETRKYVKLIFRNMFFYKLLTENESKGSHQLNKIFDIKLGFVK